MPEERHTRVQLGTPTVSSFSLSSLHPKDACGCWLFRLTQFFAVLLGRRRDGECRMFLGTHPFRSRKNWVDAITKKVLVAKSLKETVYETLEGTNLRLLANEEHPLTK
jgi:hypothetical protein